jgi:glycosyltransferase involved in cell wall biosynthesis
MDLTVVICTYNRADLLEATLSALAEQKVDGKLAWDVVVVDNNSSDRTRAVAQQAAPRLPVTYVFEGRQGLSQARNSGIAAARGEILAFTDDDVLPARDWVNSIAGAIERWGSDIVGGRILPKWEGTPPNWLLEDDTLLANLAMLTSERVRIFEPSRRESPKVWGANMAFRRSVFSRVGLFDTRRGIRGKVLYGGEETELITRAIDAGSVAVYDPSLVVFHRIGPDRMRRGYFRRLRFQRALGEALASERRGAPRWRYRRAAQLAVRWIGRALLGKPGAFTLELDFLEELGAIAGEAGWWRRR